MLVTTVMVHVKKEFLEQFKEVCRMNHENSIKEPGNRRFDILQSKDDPTKFMLYEAYDSEAAVAAHKQTAHYAAWRDTVKDWMEKPRYGVPYISVCP